MTLRAIHLTSSPLVDSRWGKGDMICLTGISTISDGGPVWLTCQAKSEFQRNGITVYLRHLLFLSHGLLQRSGLEFAKDSFI